MLIIGLCGNSGSGKSSVAKMFVDAGLPLLDADVIYHEMIECPTSPVTLAITEKFGHGVTHRDGSINRLALAKIVFAKDGEMARQELNRIAHYFVLEECYRLIDIYEKDGQKAVVIDAPLLFESGLDKKCSVIAVVTAPREMKIKRIMERDNISSSEAEARLSRQIADEELRRLCQFEFRNDATLDALSSQVHQFLVQNNLI